MFDFTNGFHDAANSIATAVSTRVLTPRAAVIWAATFNFVAFLVFHTEVANTVGKTVDPAVVSVAVIFAGLVGAIVWNLITWWLGLPTSSSHALGGIHYVDISATESVLSAIERLDPLARTHNATAVLSVGLAPGLTNLLARHCYERLPSATAIDITLTASVNGDHGPDSLRWIVDGLVAAPDRTVAGRRPQRVDLPGFGPRTAHPFPFSDQHIVSRALGVQATTRLAFESAALTAMIFALRAARVFRLLRGPRARRLLAAILSHVRFGTDRFVVQAVATDAGGQRVALAATGRQEGRSTGVVAAHVARLLRAGDIPAGVVHIDDLGDPSVLLRQLEQDLTVSLHAVG